MPTLQANHIASGKWKNRFHKKIETYPVWQSKRAVQKHCRTWSYLANFARGHAAENGGSRIKRSYPEAQSWRLHRMCMSLHICKKKTQKIGKKTYPTPEINSYCRALGIKKSSCARCNSANSYNIYRGMPSQIFVRKHLINEEWCMTRWWIYVSCSRTKMMIKHDKLRNWRERRKKKFFLPFGQGCREFWGEPKRREGYDCHPN